MSDLNPVEAQFSALRQSMVGQVASHTSLVADKIGRDMLGAEVMSVLGRVPRHVDREEGVRVPSRHRQVAPELAQPPVR